MTNSIKRAVFAASIIGNMACVGVASVQVSKNGGFPWLERKAREFFSASKRSRPQGAYSDNRLSIFAGLPVGANDTVFLGDSIFDFGEWAELMNDPQVKNRGINGDDTSSALQRLGQITSGRPARVVLLIGINNLQKRIPFEQTTTEYAEIVDRLLAASTETTIWLMPVLPVHPELYRQWVMTDHPEVQMPDQAEVEKLNGFIRQLAGARGPRVHFAPVPSLLGTTGHLREGFTFDGLHLNGRGLMEMAAQLKAAMKGDGRD